MRPIALLRSPAALGIVLLPLGGCAGEAPPLPAEETPAAAAPAGAAPGPSDPSPVDLVDPALSPAVAGEDGWNYVQTSEADLDGDGAEERIVLTARVELYRGRPAWDDGQPWQVYVEEADGARTYLYAQRLQLGTLTVRVALADAERPAAVVLLEHLPDRLSLHEASYRSPGLSSVETRFRRAVDPRGDAASPRLP